MVELTEEERLKFATWLEQSAETSKEIVDQIRKLGLPGDVLASHEIQEAKAALIIASKLRSIESVEISHSTKL